MKSFTLLKKITLCFGLVIPLAMTGWSQVTVSPVAQTICTGTNASFTVTATAGATYQWQESTDGGTTWNNLVENATTGANPANGIYTGTTGPVLTITRAPSTMNGNKYQSIVNGVASKQGTLNVGPDVSLDAATSVNCPGTSNTLNTAAAAGVSYQWQVSSNAGSSWANVVDGADATGVTYSGGATGALTISPLTTSVDGYLYRYIANNGSGCVITSAATTQKVPTLAAFTLPAAGSITATVGSSVSIPATITAGTGPFTYQWQVATGAGAYSSILSSNAAYSGATTSTLTIVSVTSATFTNRYRVIIKNAGACVTASSSYAQVGLAVPLHLTVESLTAQKLGNTSVKLSWMADASYPAESYGIQKSTDGLSFFDQGLVKGETGKTSYNFIDANTGESTIQYRLKITAQDGTGDYSGVVSLENDATDGYMGLRPSFITDGSTNLYTTLRQPEVITLTITDVAGRPQWSESVSFGKGTYHTPLNVSRLTKGLYYVHVTSKDGLSKTLPFVKN